MIRLDRTSSTPLYLQIVRQVCEKISCGELIPGETLPGWEVMLEEANIPQSVLRKVSEQLEEEGWLVRKSNRLIISRPEPVTGVRMGWDPAQLHLNLEGFHEIRVFTKTLTTLPMELCALFDVHGSEGRKAFRIGKIHLINSKPVALEMILAPSHGLRGLLMKDHRMQNLYRMVEQDYGFRLMRVSQQISMRLLTRDEASLLESTEDFPALALERTLYSEEGPIAIIDWTIPGGRCAMIEEAGTLRPFRSRPQPSEHLSIKKGHG